MRKLKEVKFRACAKPQNNVRSTVAQAGLELMLTLLRQPHHCWVVDTRNHAWLFVLFTRLEHGISFSYHAGDDFDFSLNPFRIKNHVPWAHDSEILNP